METPAHHIDRSVTGNRKSFIRLPVDRPGKPRAWFSRERRAAIGSYGRTGRTNSVVASALGLLVLLIGVGGCSSTEKRSTTATSVTTAVSTTGPVAPDADEEDAPAGGPVGPVSVPTTPPPASTASCRSGDPLANVYHPDRLKVITPCATVSGTVAVVRSEADGDVHFNLALDASYANLINDGNVSGENGNLVIEIVPADRPGCSPGAAPRAAIGTYDYGTCSGSAVPTPAVNSHVTVTGPYVLDTFHGWMEIHPAWAVVSDGGSSSPAAPTSPQTPSTAVAGGAYYANCAAARDAGVAPLHRGDPGYRSALDRDGDGIACE